LFIPLFGQKVPHKEYFLCLLKTENQLKPNLLNDFYHSASEEYKDLKTKLINDPFSASNVNGLIVAWSEQIRAATQEAEEEYSDALSVREWENSLYAFMDHLELARNN
jgi:hypothetical protein